MCLIAFAWKPNAQNTLVLVSNRDEFYQRPSRPANFWPENKQILAGKDLLHQGTWLGITRQGKFAAITNFRGKDPRLNLKSRGHLPLSFLNSTIAPEEFAEQLQKEASHYGGFNILLGDREQLVYYSNKSGQPPAALAPGIYGLSNHFLDTPWPKVNASKQALEALLQRRPDPNPEELLQLLQDKQQAPDELLPDTGVGVVVERMLSAQFIHSPAYGTRATTSLILDKQGRAFFAEQNHAGSGSATSPTFYEFNIETE